MKAKRIENVCLSKLDLGDKIILNEKEMFTFDGKEEENNFTFIEKVSNEKIELILSYTNSSRNILLDNGKYIRNGKQKIYSPNMKCYKEKLNLINGVVK
jgi:hypothetical protein